MANTMKMEWNVLYLSANVKLMQNSQCRRNFTLMMISTIRISRITKAKSESSEENKTPQNNVEPPVIIASISSLLFISFLYGLRHI